MDLRAVKTVPRARLVACAVAAAANAQSLMDDAELLSLAERRARAAYLAIVATEEVGKALSLMVLSLLPEKIRGQARVGRLLEWHELKIAGGLLLAMTPPGAAAAPTLAALPRPQLAQMLRETTQWVRADDKLKAKGLYVDLEKSGHITEPSAVTQAEVSAQFARARQAVATASSLTEPTAPSRLADPPKETLEFAEALVTALAESRRTRTPEDAADIMLDAVTKLAER